MRLLGRWRLGNVPRGEQGHGIHVAVRLGRQANAEVEIRLRPFRIAARANRPHDLTFVDRGPDPNADRPKMDERHRVSARGANRQTLPFVWQLPREGNDTGGGSTDLSSGRRADVDAAVLAARIGIVVRHEWPQHGAVDRPSPCVCA